MSETADESVDKAVLDPGLVGNRGTRLQESQALHQRVIEFAEQSVADGAEDSDDDATFERLALDVAEFQARAIPRMARLREIARSQRGAASSLEGIPAVPVEALRFTSLFAFPLNQALQTFQTSGTTLEQTGRHRFRTTETYRKLALLAGRPALLGQHRLDSDARAIIVALMPFGGLQTTSSLGFMAQCFMQAWDARGLDALRSPNDFTLADARRWLFSDRGVDLDGLRRVVELGHQVGEPIVLLTTSFALSLLLEALGERTLPLPPDSVVMPTGGFKGRAREVDPEMLRHQVEVQLRPAAVVYEYGMTELSSQLYERTRSHGVASAGIYTPPRWLKVIPVDPVTLDAVPRGTPGLASFIDLANVDSAVRVVTRDWVQQEGAGLRFLGRDPGAPLRGCSLAVEALVLHAASASSARTRDDLPASKRVEAAARSRLEGLRDAARCLADRTHPAGRALRERLVLDGVLSAQGIELALERCLELDAPEHEIEALVHSVTSAPRVWVVLSATVFVAAYRAIALGLAASQHVKVRPSRRDPHFVDLLHSLVPDLFERVSELDVAPGDHVHAYGSDDTMNALRRELARDGGSDGNAGKVVLHAHAAGFGVGWVATQEAAAAAATGFADDGVLFDQRGCLSPRVIAIDTRVNLDHWLEQFAAALIEREKTVPRGRLSEQEQAAVTRFRDTAALVADEVRPLGQSWVAIQRSSKRAPSEHTPMEHVLIPPVGRHWVVLQTAQALERFASARQWVTSVGVAGDATHLKQAERCFPNARICLPGNIQSPPFDGPVDRRTPRGGEWL